MYKNATTTIPVVAVTTVLAKPVRRRVSERVNVWQKYNIMSIFLNVMRVGKDFYVDDADKREDFSLDLSPES